VHDRNRQTDRQTYRITMAIPRYALQYIAQK